MSYNKKSLFVFYEITNKKEKQAVVFGLWGANKKLYLNLSLINDFIHF